MLQIVDVHGQVDPPRPVVQNLIVGARVADVGFDVGDGVGQSRQLSGAVFGHHRQLHRVRIFNLVGHPRDLDDPLAVNHQVRGVLAARGVDPHALPARDVSDDLLTSDRVAAGRAVDQHVVDALDQNALVAHAQRAFDGVGHLLQLRRLGLLDLGQVFGLDEARQYGAGHQLAVAYGREHVLDFGVAIVVEKFRQLRVFQHLFGLQSQLDRLFLKNLTTDLYGFGALALGDPVFDLTARLRGGDEVEPVAARLVTRRRHDLDHVAVLNLVLQRDDLAVDFRADALVADLGMNRIGEVDRRGVARQLDDLALRREGQYLPRE